MTESEWLTATNPESILRHLRERASERKLRLLCCQFCRGVWGWLHSEGKQAVEAAEMYADALLSESALVASYAELLPLRTNDFEPLGTPMTNFTEGEAATAARRTARPPEEPFSAINSILVADCTAHAAGYAVPFERQTETRMAMQAEQASQIRCLFGNPFRPVSFSPFWLTPTVVALARSIYEGRSFDRLPILADALQEAGCEDESVLAHCRGDGAHARGCWVVDGVLGKV